MKLRLEGSKEDVIRKLDDCDYCIFEHIIPEENRKIKVLDIPVPERHPHRTIIEQICGKNYVEYVL